MRVIVVDYHTEWPELFEKESQKLAAIFKDELVDIHHIKRVIYKKRFAS